MPTIDFHAQHAPAGAQAQFTIGKFSCKGGFGIGVAGIPKQYVFIGTLSGGVARCLPFYENAFPKDAEAFTQTQAQPATAPKIRLQAYRESEIKRAYGIATDSWQADVLKLEVFTPVVKVPDPERAERAELKRAIRPSVAARLTIDNSKSPAPIKAFFAIGGWPRFIELAGTDLVGVASADGYGFAVRSSTGVSPVGETESQAGRLRHAESQARRLHHAESQAGRLRHAESQAGRPRHGGISVRPFCDWSLTEPFNRAQPQQIWLAGTAGIIIDVPARKKVSLDVALGFYRTGPATVGRDAVYMYTNCFGSLEDVLQDDLADRERVVRECARADAELRRAKLNDDQRFLIAHAVHSYFPNTQLLLEGRSPVWVVNEGSFMMMNTFDLTVDHLFFEMRQNPWTVRNELDNFYEHYSYYDTVHSPDSPAVQHPGGLAFTHDMGVNNVFTPKGRSSYEVKDQPGCFSHMTHEELVNWVLCGADYCHGTGDREWLTRRTPVFRECLASLQNRDNPDPKKRNGIMGLDSSRCGREGEITTYDSLDASLGQARNNLYLAVKTWAAYLALEMVLGEMGYAAESKSARRSADLAARTIASKFDKKLGYVPAVFEAGNTSATIPAIEGLLFPHRLGLLDDLKKREPHRKLFETLRLHFRNVLKPGVCLFKDNGWKMSSTSTNSWQSKIFLCQHVARAVLGARFGADEAKHDRAHADWWRVGAAPWAVIDQIWEGKTTGGGCIYPRGVTNILWLDE